MTAATSPLDRLALLELALDLANLGTDLRCDGMTVVNLLQGLVLLIRVAALRFSRR
jgi:hypothetical protein